MAAAEGERLPIPCTGVAVYCFNCTHSMQYRLYSVHAEGRYSTVLVWANGNGLLQGWTWLL